MRQRVGQFHYPVKIGDASGEHFEEMLPLVDTAALYSRFKASFLEGLGHRADAMRRFRLGDETVIDRPIGSVPIQINEETHPTICIFGEEGSIELLGAVTLEEFGLAPYPVNETLVPVIGFLAAAVPV